MIPVIAFTVLGIIGIFLSIPEEGTKPEIGILDDEIFPRPIVVNLLKNIFQPDKNQSFYHSVCGEHGTGKTTLVRIASKEVGSGVIYIDVPSNVKDFGEAFGKAINFAFEERVSFTKQLIRKLGSINSDEPDNLMWEMAMKAFKRAAKAYKDKHDRPAVIVYDNVSRLAHESPNILDILQDDTKDNADNRTYIAVFVSSKGLVPRRMQSFRRPMEIGDLSKDESMHYLVNRRKVKDEEAERLYKLVDGRFVDLKFVVIEKSILDETEKKFRNAQINPKQKYHKVGRKIINSLLEAKELDFMTYTDFFDNDKEADEILEKNVFVYHPGTNTVTFQSQSVELYIKTKADIFGIKLIDLTPTNEDNVSHGKKNMWTYFSPFIVL
ncbi:hypothetical protein RhiirA4_485673 [Rhizophagus irregularis]|uniref:ORC1/DEAH AAA+ ATPase domain-containing protein n=1 Tax=Rhizophagus irregularis TaxID=588596 RepID=A0A2I1HQF4_9GLOM|nr:hypothetical protein RhiirA4_485673 [Rhizophagus irregularis]